jgi:hypothetical protein
MDWMSHGRRAGGQRGQASVLLVGAMLAVVLGAFVLAAVARGGAGREGAQTAADLGALAGARAMLSAYPRLFEPAVIDGRVNPRHLDRGAYLALGRDAARRVAAANGARESAVTFPDGESFAPVRIHVAVRLPLVVDLGARGRELFQTRARAEAELAAGGPATTATGGGYDGPLAYRQGKPMRPDVAQAFDRMAAAARADGVALIVVSGYRSDAEQAILFARNPNPKWVARPGTSLHRNATELDLGPSSAYGWLAANARRFGFIQRYAWEAWHYDSR